MNPFHSFRDYEEFIYTLQQRFPCVKSSSLVVIRRGKSVAILQGDLTLDAGYRLVVHERLSSESEIVVIESYGYEIWHHTVKETWYDSQPHPDEPTLFPTHPHHKHVPPNIKHHRVPAPQMSFIQPNLPALIQEIEEYLQNSEHEAKF